MSVLPCTGPAKYRGFSARYQLPPGTELPPLVDGTLDKWWHSTVGPDGEYYGSFNDDNFDDQTGIYLVPTSGQYIITFGFTLYLQHDDILTPPVGEDASGIVAIVTPSDGGVDRTLAGSIAAVTEQQQLILTAGEVSSNTIDVSAIVSAQNIVYLYAGDKVRLEAVSRKPWKIVESLRGIDNTFAIARL